MDRNAAISSTTLLKTGKTVPNINYAKAFQRLGTSGAGGVRRLMSMLLNGGYGDEISL
jgi:hypothetical protein